jgi:hypothetical protein
VKSASGYSSSTTIVRNARDQRSFAAAAAKRRSFTRTPFVSPSLGIELLFGPDGFFEQIVAVDDRGTDLMHAAPPRISGTHA